MGLQQVNARSLRRVAAGVGEELVQAAIGSDGVWFVFTTAAHRHGCWNRRTGEVQWLPDDEHRTSCREHFPETMDTWDRERQARFAARRAESLARMEKVKH